MTTPTSLPSLNVEEIPIDDLRPDPANPRRISEDELNALERSLRQFGFVQPVLARREDRTVIGGHQRLVAARRLGLTSVPVTWLDVTVEQARLLGLALNKISGSWDEQLLARLIADLQAVPDVDLTLSGFGEDEIGDLLRKLEVREKRDGHPGRSPATCGSSGTIDSCAGTARRPRTWRASSTVPSRGSWPPILPTG